MKRKDRVQKKKEKFMDDGRVIANMNVDGMPWYHPNAKNHETTQTTPLPEMTRKEKAALTRGVLGAAMLVGLVFFIVFGGFILFCVFVWFK